MPLNDLPRAVDDGGGTLRTLTPFLLRALGSKLEDRCFCGQKTSMSWQSHQNDLIPRRVQNIHNNKLLVLLLLLLSAGKTRRIQAQL